MDFYWCPVDEIFAGGVRLTHKVLRALAVDAEQLPPGEILSGELARLALEYATVQAELHGWDRSRWGHGARVQ